MKKIFFVFLLLASCKQTTSTDNSNPLVLPATFTGTSDFYMNGIIKQHLDSVRYIVRRYDSVLEISRHLDGMVAYADTNFRQAISVNPPKNSIFIYSRTDAHDSASYFQSPNDTILFDDSKTTLTLHCLVTDSVKHGFEIITHR